MRGTERDNWKDDHLRMKIVGSFSLEIKFKIIEFNCEPNTAKSNTNHVLKPYISILLNTSMNADSTTLLCGLFQCLTAL